MSFYEGSRLTKCQFIHCEPLDYGRIEHTLQNCRRHLPFYLLAKLVKMIFFSSEVRFRIYFVGVSLLKTIIMLSIDIEEISPNNNRGSRRS